MCQTLSCTAALSLSKPSQGWVALPGRLTLVKKPNCEPVFARSSPLTTCPATAGARRYFPAAQKTAFRKIVV